MSAKVELLEAYGSYREYHIKDHNLSGKNHFLLLEDCTPMIEHAKRMSDMEPGKEFRWAAEIPYHAWNRARREGWINDRKAWKRWANDPDNKAFRIWPGRL